MSSKTGWGKGKNDSLLGRRFGKLTTLKKVNRETGLYFECECDCGEQIIVSQRSLMNSKKRDCGKCNKTS